MGTEAWERGRDGALSEVLSRIEDVIKGIYKRDKAGRLTKEDIAVLIELKSLRDYIRKART